MNHRHRIALKIDHRWGLLPLLPTRPMLTLLLSPQFSYPSAFVPLSDDWTWGTIQHSGLSNWVILIPKIWFLKLLHVVPYCSLISEQFLLIFYAVCNFLRFTLNNNWSGRKKKHFRVAKHWFCGVECKLLGTFLLEVFSFFLVCSPEVPFLGCRKSAFYTLCAISHFTSWN